jgi:hypothetical protein
MSAIEVRQVENGFVLITYTDDECVERIATDKNAMLEILGSFFSSPEPSQSPEQPKDTSNEDSTEAMVEEGSGLSGSYVKAESVSKMLPPESDPITPMADLSGADCEVYGVGANEPAYSDQFKTS